MARFTRRRIIVGIGAAALVAATGPALGTTTAPPLRPFEVNVSHDPRTNSGEPTIAVDPADPQRIVVTYTQVSLQHELTHGMVPSVADLTEETHCGYAVTTDGGATWKRAPIPVTDAVQRACADPFVVFDSHGTVYVAAGTYDPSIMVGGVRFIRSTDGGRTWSAPIQPISTLTGIQRTKPGPWTYVGPSMSIDRTWLAVDSSTGVLYLSSRDLGGIHGHRYITSSRDGGRTWAAVNAVDSDDYPVGDGPITAANGAVAIAYGAARLPVPASKCTCLVLAVSTDGARTFTRRPAPFAISNQPTATADPTHPGRYAVLGLDSTATKVEVHVTDDAGKTWRPAITLGEPPANTRSRPWIAFSPTGVLGAMWRTVYADKSSDVFATVSRDGGRTFGPPLRINGARSPAPSGQELGDDFSHVTLDATTLRVGWGDWRSGHMDAWYGRVVLAAFT